MLETEMAKLTSARLRVEQARYFYVAFVESCGPPQDSYFHMVAYFDAFLFSLTSVEEMAPVAERNALKNDLSFRFMKALRNITTHHSVLAASQSDAKFLRPFVRQLFNSLGGVQQASGRLALEPSRLRAIFDAIERERPVEKRTLDVARRHLESLEVSGTTIYLEGLMQNALESASVAVA